MKYYVLGYYEGSLVLITRREFPTLEEANNYAASVAAAYKPFVVGGVV
jgi:hypothetical protein